MKQYTYIAEPNAEAFLRRVLPEIANGSAVALKRAGINVMAVILGGQEGRGQGGVTPKGMPSGALKFTVLFYLPQDIRKAKPFFEKLTEKWKKEYELRTEYTGTTLPRLRAMADNFSVRQFMRGHDILFGLDSVLDSVPVYDWSDLTWRDGVRMLVNCGTGILQAKHLIKQRNKSVDIATVRHLLYSALVGCGDALLIQSGLYCDDGAERFNHLKKYQLMPELTKPYGQALKYIYAPRTEATELNDFYHTVVKLFMQTVMMVAAQKNGIQYQDAVDAARSLPGADKKAPHRWRNLLPNLIYARDLKTNCNILEDPVVKLLPLLVEQLFSPDDADEKYLRLWRKLSAC